MDRWITVGEKTLWPFSPSFGQVWRPWPPREQPGSGRIWATYRARGARTGLRLHPWNLNRVTPAEEGAARYLPLALVHRAPSQGRGVLLHHEGRRI